MSQEIRNLEPRSIWNKFADLNAVPRPSKKEDRVIQFMKNFGNNLGLETFEDEIRNVIIRKPATKGMENRKPLVLQGHLDMVHQKNNDTTFDFLQQGIEMYIDHDWVRARGTTLGADNGMGVAMIMAILESTTMAHPAIEALFTIDEETGMTGALNLKGGILQGEILLNMDTEEDDEICIGCAGGIDVTATKNYIQEATPPDSIAYLITVKGLNGGHSGMDINKGLGNANKIMNRFLYENHKSNEIRVEYIDGGSLRNAIPRESNSKIVVPAKNKEAFLKLSADVILAIKNEFKVKEANLSITLVPTDLPEKVMSWQDQEALLKALYTAHNGVYSMSASMENLVETSNNIARVLVEKGTILIHNLTRSSVETSKMDLANAIASAYELSGCTVEMSEGYPGWTPNVNSEILEITKSIYEKQNNEKPKVVACHAGLECGILGKNYPNMEMVSFGPTIHGAHSPDERVSIKSVQKFYNFVVEILEKTPLK